MRFAINNEPEKILPVGGTFFEPSSAVHTTNGSARPDGPMRAVVFMLVPNGSPLTSPARRAHHRNRLDDVCRCCVGDHARGATRPGLRSSHDRPRVSNTGCHATLR
jgi:hypothetical protein